MRGAAASAAETASPTIANRFVPLNIVIGAPPLPLGPGRTSGRSDATTADPPQRRGDPWDQRVRLGERPDSVGDGSVRLAGRDASSAVVGRCATSATQIREDGQHPPVVVGRLADPEFPEDVPHVGLDGLRAQEELLADAVVRMSLGHEQEDLELASGEFVERAARARSPDHPGDDRRVENALALVDAVQRVDEYGYVRDALLEEVAGALRVLLEQTHGVPRLDVVREHEHSDLGMGAADLLGGDEAFIGVRRRHLDVDDRHVRTGQLHPPHELLGVGGLPDDLESGLFEQPGEPFAKKRFVVGDYDSHGSTARSLTLPSPPRSTVSRPSRAPTRSRRATRSSPRSSCVSTSRRSAPPERLASTTTPIVVARAASATTVYAAVSTGGA